MIGPSDVDLLGRIAQGDEAALGALYDRHAPLLLGVARRLVGEDAEDLVHDVFLEAWLRAGTYDARRAGVRTWLMVRLRSRALDLHRRPERTRRVDAPAEPVGHAADPSATADRTAVIQALSLVPPPQRRVLELAYYRGMSSAEIAQAEALPLGTVKSRTAGGMRKLRQQLQAGS